MAKLPIVIYPNPVLAVKCDPVTVFDDKLAQLAADMAETMYAAPGVGLAAPQVGKSIRMFVVDASPWAEEEPELADFKKTFINAEIYERFGDEWRFSEGCLSLPGIHEDVMRPSGIKIRYVDENFVEHDEEYSGYAARVIQHEYDHLDGKLFVDHLSPLRRTLLKSKLVGMTKGNFKAHYKCKLVKK